MGTDNKISIPFEKVMELIRETQQNVAFALWKEYPGVFKEDKTYMDDKNRFGILNENDFSVQIMNISKLPEDIIVLQKYLNQPKAPTA